ncbi:hypothetical protein BgiBS90_019203, partial [Biomphalaria glabrata]
LCYVDLSNCGGYEVNICYCRPTNERNVVSVILNVTADMYFSKAFLQGTIYHFENKIKSKELMLPYILDSSHAGIHLYINDKIDQVDFCNKTINQTTAVIVVERSINELQYSFSLLDSKTSVYLRNATNFLFYIVEIKEETVFRIVYEIHENPKIRINFKCTVRMIPQQTDSVDPIVLLLAILLSVAILLVIILMIYIISMKKRSHRNLLIQDKKNSSDECEEVVLLETQTFSVTTTNEIQDKKNSSDECEEVGLLERKVLSDTTTNENNEMDSGDICDLDKAKAIKKIVTGSKLPSTPNTSVSVVMSLPFEVLNLIKDIEGKEDTEAQKAGLLEASVVGLESLINSKADKKTILNELMIYQCCLMTTVKVESVSNRRPEKWPGTNIPYPYFQKDSYDGESSLRVGVGRIVSVKFIEGNNNQILLTKHEFESQNGREITKWVEIDIHTSRHVVFDDQEAKGATVSLMLDSPEIQRVKLEGQRVSKSNMGENWILLTCVSCDIDLFNILRQKVEKYNYAWSRINERFKLFNTKNNEGYFLSVSENTFRKAKFTQLSDLFMKDTFSYSYALNTYFRKENVAIFVERTSETLICPPSKDKKWTLGSLPLVIKNLDTM